MSTSPTISLNWHQACSLLILASETEDRTPEEQAHLKALRDKLASRAGQLKRAVEQPETEWLQLDPQERRERVHLLNQVPESVWEEVRRRDGKR